MRYAHERRYATGVGPAAAPALINSPQGVSMPVVPGQGGYESAFRPSELALRVFGNRPTRTRVYSVRYSSIAGSNNGVSTNVNFQKGGLVKEMWGGSTNVTITVGQAASNYGNLCYELQLRYGNSDPIFTDYLRGDVLFGVNNERGLIFRPPLIILPQNQINILANNLLTTILTTLNIGFLVEEPTY